jgi:Prophage CP4-57 regulatory protein (AlpA)
VQEVFIPFRGLRSLGIPYCRLHINRKIGRGEFPAAVWLGGNRKVWRLSDIEKWLASRPVDRPTSHAESGDDVAA